MSKYFGTKSCNGNTQFIEDFSACLKLSREDVHSDLLSSHQGILQAIKDLSEKVTVVLEALSKGKTPNPL
jgi:hypothetical protein